MKIEPSQMKVFHLLLSRTGMTANKISMISGITEGRTISSRDLSKEEAALLIEHLRTLDKNSKESEKMRRKIISMAHEMNWREKGKVNMAHVNEWCEKYGYLHKPLNKYTYNELPALVTQFQNGPYKHRLSNV